MLTFNWRIRRSSTRNLDQESLCRVISMGVDMSTHWRHGSSSADASETGLTSYVIGGSRCRPR